MYYEVEERSGKRPRSQNMRLRVIFPDDTEYCYKSATTTFTEAIRKIGADKVAGLNMEWRHYALCSKDPVPGYESYMKPLDNGWWINTQSNTGEKYRLLKAIVTKLGLDCKLEIGTDFETSKTKGFVKTRKSVGKLAIKFADGKFVGGVHPKDSYIQAITKIGLDTVYYKDFDDHGQKLVTSYKRYENQVQSGDKWITIPVQTKDKISALRRISQKLNLGLEITVIDEDNVRDDIRQ